MPHATPPLISLSRAQALALAHVADRLGPEIFDLWPDERRRAPIVRALYNIREVAAETPEPDPFEADLEHFGSIFGDIRSAEFITVIRARMRDLLAVTLLWRAVESLTGVGERSDLLGVPAIDDPAWRAEVLDLLIDRGVDIVLPGEPHRPGTPSFPLVHADDARPPAGYVADSSNPSRSPAARETPP